jgi:hypothetical protein
VKTNKKSELSQPSDNTLTLKAVVEQKVEQPLCDALSSKQEEQNFVQPGNDITLPCKVEQNDIKMDTYVCPATPESDTDHHNHVSPPIPCVASPLLDTRQVDLPAS